MEARGKRERGGGREREREREREGKEWKKRSRSESCVLATDARTDETRHGGTRVHSLRILGALGALHSAHTCLQLETKTSTLHFVCVRRKEYKTSSFLSRSMIMYACTSFDGVELYISWGKEKEGAGGEGRENEGGEATAAVHARRPKPKPKQGTRPTLDF